MTTYILLEYNQQTWPQNNPYNRYDPWIFALPFAMVLASGGIGFLIGHDYQFWALGVLASIVILNFVNLWLDDRWLGRLKRNPGQRWIDAIYSAIMLLVAGLTGAIIEYQAGEGWTMLSTGIAIGIVLVALGVGCLARRVSVFSQIVRPKTITKDAYDRVFFALPKTRGVEITRCPLCCGSYAIR